MAMAIQLAAARLGHVAPNPAVGCVIVQGDECVGVGATGEGGRPHAEEIALLAADDRAAGATAYVTLEPCHSRSSGAPGCSDRLIDAGVHRVVAAVSDPHPTAMDGFAKLGAAGLRVEVGLMAEQASPLTAGFFSVLDKGRPLVGLSSSTEHYDTELVLGAGEHLEQALARLAKTGITRVCVRPSSPLAGRLAAAGLVDVFD